MLNWTFNSKKFLRPWHNVYDELCAPGVGILGDTMMVMGLIAVLQVIYFWRKGWFK